MKFRSKFVKNITAASLSLVMAASSAAPLSTFAQETTTTWKSLYAGLGVDTSQTGEGYYDAVTSATQFKSFHAKDIPALVNEVKDADGNILSLDGVNLTNTTEEKEVKLGSATFTDSSKYGTGEFVIVPDDTMAGYVWNDYFSCLYAATISDGTTTVGAMPWIDFYGESATSGAHYNKVQISLNNGISVGSNKAEVNRYAAFYDENGDVKPGNYTVTLYAQGYKTLSAVVTVAEYEYMYAALTWNEYWQNEGVVAAGSDASSNVLDSRNEADKGAFDAVSRATTTHGVHRGSFQCSATIYTKDGSEYHLSHWSDDGKTMIFTDGESAAWNKGTLTFTDGTSKEMDHYTVDGVKYVPVRVDVKDAAAFKNAYETVANGEKLYGGYSEQQLTAYTKIANVNKSTNGLKTASKNALGKFVFSQATQGSGSGLKDTAQKSVDMNNLTVTVKEASGSYGEFLRVDLTGSEYGELGSKMYGVTWKYFGETNPATNGRARAVATYGTKFAADNWMHKSNGIQLGLTESARCSLPDGKDGTGYWQIVLKAMGYADTTINIQVEAKNIVGAVPPEDDPVKDPTENTQANTEATTQATTPTTTPTTTAQAPVAQTILAKNVNKTLKAKVLKKKKQVLPSINAKANTPVSYSVVKYGNKKAKKYIALQAKTGKIVVKKKAPKGTYKVTVRATASADANFLAATKDIVVTIKVK